MLEMTRTFKISLASDHSNTTVGEANKTFFNSFKELNLDESLDFNFPIFGPDDWKHLKNSQAEADLLRGTKTFIQVERMKLTEKHRARFPRNNEEIWNPQQIYGKGSW